MLGGCDAVKEKLTPEDRQTFLSKHLKDQESGKPQVSCRLKKKNEMLKDGKTGLGGRA